MTSYTPPEFEGSDGRCASSQRSVRRAGSACSAATGSGTPASFTTSTTAQSATSGTARRATLARVARSSRLEARVAPTSARKAARRRDDPELAAPFRARLDGLPQPLAHAHAVGGVQGVHEELVALGLVAPLA